MRVAASGCPARDCRAASPRQVEVRAEQLQRAGLTDSWITGAMRCTYCGTIYSVGPGGQKAVRGYFEGDLMEPARWRPIQP